ncbi:MAG: hypothetical protein WC385_00635, partial [Candidatus Paceibacterota bacterium]
MISKGKSIKEKKYVTLNKKGILFENATIKWRLWVGLSLLICLVLPFNFAFAASPPTILSYQGRLADSDGNLLGGAGTNYYFKISFYTSSTVGAGTKVWPTADPTAFTSTVRHGLFNINIGDTTGGYPDVLDYDFSINPNIYLQIEVSSNGVTYETLSPRQSITSAAFSQLSGAVQGTGASTMGSLVVSGNSTTTNSTTTGASYLGTSVGLAGEYINTWGDLAAYLPMVVGWNTASDDLNWLANWNVASSSVLSISTTSISSILSLPNLSITEAQISDLQAYLTAETDPFYSLASSSLLRFGTSSDALTEGVNNKFYTQARNWLDIAASTTLTTTLTNAATAYSWGNHAGLYLVDLMGGLNGVFGNTTTTNATTSRLAITDLANTYLAVNGQGQVIATSSPTSVESDPIYTLASSSLLRFGTSSDALTEGTINKFYTDTRVANYIIGSSTLGLQNFNAGQGTTTSLYASTRLGLNSQYISQWSDLSAYLPSVTGWDTASDNLNWQTNWNTASSSVLLVSSTSISSIISLPNLSITKSQVSDFGSPLYSFTESDPIFLAASTSLDYVKTELDPVFTGS